MAAYCRVSTDREAQLESLENQKRFFEDFAEKQGHQLVKIYADEGISGRQMKGREQFLQMLRDAQEGAFDLVTVKDISRFSRNTVDFLNAFRRLKSLGVAVWFLSGSQGLLGDSEFVLTIFGALAQEESANLSRRVKFGKQEGAKRGRVPPELYGYDRVDAFTLRINPAEGETVKRIFHWYTGEGIGCRAIALRLTALGIPAKRGGDWNAKGVRRILGNPVYAGELVNNRFETVDFLSGKTGTRPQGEWLRHPRPELALVTRKEFDAAQRILESRAVPKAESPKGRYPLSGLLCCASCGEPLVRRKRKAGARWLCPTPGCPGHPSVGEEELNRALGMYFAARLPGETPRPNRGESASAALHQREERVKTLFQAGIISLEELKERLSQLEKMGEELQKWEGINRPVFSAGERFSHLTRPELHRLVERIDADQNRVTVHLKQL